MLICGLFGDNEARCLDDRCPLRTECVHFLGCLRCIGGHWNQVVLLQCLADIGVSRYRLDDFTQHAGFVLVHGGRGEECVPSCCLQVDVGLFECGHIRQC